MKRLYLLILLLVTVNGLKAQVYQWTKIFGGLGADYGDAVTSDDLGNVYVAGYFFNDSVDFDPSPSTAFLHDNGGGDIFLAKYNASGSLVWVKDIGSTGNERVNALTLDHSGNIILVGHFAEVIDLDPSPALALLSVPDSMKNGFLAKYDNNGNFLWGLPIKGPDNDYSYGVHADISNNILVTGYFSESIDINPATTADLLTSNGGWDCFLAKFDAAGNYLWAFNIGGIGNDVSKSVITDEVGNIYYTGSLKGTVDLDPSAIVYNLTSPSATTSFIAKYTSSGSFKWAINIGSEFNYLGFDNVGNICVSGYYQTVRDFDPGPATLNLTPAGMSDIAIAKYDTSGALIWAKSIGGTNNEITYGMTVDTSSNIYITGYFRGTADFDPGTATNNLTATGIQPDVFIAKYDINGNYVWANKIGSSIDDEGKSISINKSGDLFITGYFGLTVDFCPGTVTDDHTSNGDYDVFLTRFSDISTGTLPVNVLETSHFKVYPNPNNGILFCETTENAQLSIYNSSGSVVFNHALTTGKHALDISSLVPGIYLVRSSQSPQGMVLIKQ